MAKPPSPSALPAPGAELDLVIDNLAYGGQALGRVAGVVVFVDHALPGQRVRVRVVRTRARFLEARVVEVLAQSPAYNPPFCRHFGLCGGCQWQDLAYPEQLAWKGRHVKESLRHLSGLTPEVILPPVPSPGVRFYRNKMEFAFAPRTWTAPAAMDLGAGGLALGLHVATPANQVFNVEECFLLSPRTVPLVAEVRRRCRESRLPAWDPQARRGFWRSLVVREGKRTGQMLVHLLCGADGREEVINALAAHLQARFPDITTMVHSTSGSRTSGNRTTASRILWGPGYITEHLLGLKLRVSPQSFLQPNTEAAEGLYDAVRQLGEFTGRETVWDLYCGIGGIALSLAGQVRRVVGFELAPEAVADAKLNARLNGLENCRFLAGDLKETIRQAMKPPPGGRPRPDAVITDPPRSGLHPKVIQALKELAPSRLLMVSCNPATLARDLALLADRYELTAIQPFDLFPHTAHIECLARLEARKAGQG
jgi:23S rRNA (uracil1939-C5)-methyltransferase